MVPARQGNALIQHPDNPRSGPVTSGPDAYMQTKESIVWR